MMIIGIIAAFAVPAASTILRGSLMNQAAQIITDQLTTARQVALAKNHQVEVRFIRFADPETPNDVGSDGQPGNFHAIWVFEDTGTFSPTVLDANGNPAPIMAPVDKPQLLPQAIILSMNQTLSTLVMGQSGAPITPQQPLATDPQTYPRSTNGAGTPYTYVPFRYRFDGSTNLLPQTSLWYVTLQNINDQIQNNLPPANFVTILVDPVGGTLRFFRPGV